MIAVAQLLMHLVEPFLDRNIIRGTFSYDQDRDWHKWSLIQWAAIYGFIIAVHAQSGDLGVDWILLLLARGAVFRWTCQSIVLNWLLIKDSQDWRTWYTLSENGIDGWVVRTVMRVPYNLDGGPLLRQHAAEKAVAIAAIIITFTLLVL